MMKCPDYGRDSATHRAAVMVCPGCGRVLDARELFQLLEELGVRQDTVERVKNELRWKTILS